MDIENLIKIKAELLCFGLRYDKEAQKFFKRQNPYSIGKTGNVGLHIILENKLSVLVSTTHVFDKKTQYRLKEKNKKWILIKNDKEVCEVTPIKMPVWYPKKTSSGSPTSTVFLHEGLNFIHQCYQGCGYFQTKKACKFCGTGPIWKIPTPEDVGETVELAYKENSNYQVCLGGGSPITAGKGTEYFLDCIKEIRKRVKEIPIWIEMVPPAENKYIRLMIDAGANSFGFNIEIWDDDLRKEICPGKFEVNKERYFAAFNFVNKKLGKNKIGTLLIAGLEPKESTLEGVEVMSQMGVRVCLLAFKPWDTCEYVYKESCNPEDLLWISKRAADFMKTNKIDPQKNYGCLNCPSCTIDGDFLKTS